VKAQLIYNARAGQLDERRDLEKAVHYLEEQRWQVSWRETHGPSDATTYAREATAQGCPVAIAAGGDGTVGEVVNGLVGSDTALGVLPIGTSNVWAKEVGIPSAPYLLHPQVRASLGVGAPWLLQAARVLVEGQRVRVDVGRVNDRHFLLWAGVGLDARVTEEMEQKPQVKQRLGRLAFYLAGVYTALGYRGVRAEVLVDDSRVTRRMILAVISNIQLYGGVVRISPLAQLDDGLLDVCIFQGRGVLSTARHLASVFANPPVPAAAHPRGRRLPGIYASHHRSRAPIPDRDRPHQRPLEPVPASGGGSSPGGTTGALAAAGRLRALRSQEEELTRATHLRAASHVDTDVKEANNR